MQCKILQKQNIHIRLQVAAYSILTFIDYPLVYTVKFTTTSNIRAYTFV